MLAASTERPGRDLTVTVRSVALVPALVISAYLMALALGPSEHPWLAWVALLPLFVAIRTLRPLGALLSGALWGSSLYVFGVALASLGSREGLLSFALLTAAPAAYALLGSLVTRRIGFNPLVLGVAWMGMELAFEPLGLRHGLLAGTQGDGLLVHWVGGALGYVLVAFLVAFANSALLLTLTGVCVDIGSKAYAARGEPRKTRLIPQTFCCFPLYAIPVSQPRAPPLHTRL